MLSSEHTEASNESLMNEDLFAAIEGFMISGTNPDLQKIFNERAEHNSRLMSDVSQKIQNHTSHPHRLYPTYTHGIHNTAR